MAHFTQLNLEGNPGSKPAPTPAKPGTPGGKAPTTGKPTKKHPSTATVMAIGGSLAAAAFVAALTLGTNGCSKSSKNTIAVPTAATSATAQMTPVSPAPTIPSAVPAASAKAAKKSSRQHILYAYKNADYGISFLYPKQYSMKKGSKANLEWTGLGPVEMNFVQPGGMTLAAVQLPDGTFPGTDFVSGFFNVSVNSKVTAEQCAEFAFEDEKHAASSVVDNDMDAGSPAELKKVTFGATEFTEAESSGGEAAKHADAKYYHVYENGACYEFALGVETAEGSMIDGIKPVDNDAVFRKLNWMLATVKITPVGTLDKTIPAVAVSTPDVPAPKVATPDTSTPKTGDVTTKGATTTAAVDSGKN